MEKRNGEERKRHRRPVAFEGTRVRGAKRKGSGVLGSASRGGREAGKREGALGATGTAWAAGISPRPVGAGGGTVAR
jgi:hypothetical protein